MYYDFVDGFFDLYKKYNISEDDCKPIYESTGSLFRYLIHLESLFPTEEELKNRQKSINETKCRFRKMQKRKKR